MKIDQAEINRLIDDFETKAQRFDSIGQEAYETGDFEGASRCHVKVRTFQYCIDRLKELGA